MKKIFNILLSAAALFAFAPVVGAQGTYSIDGQIKDPKTGAALEWPKDNGVHQASDFAYSKDISSPQSDGTYWIKLESFSTGYASTIESAAPADIVLVLDVSSSMSTARGTTTDYYIDATYNNNVNNNWNYSVGNYANFYYKYNGELCPITRFRSEYIGTGLNRYRYYHLSFVDSNGDRHYFQMSDDGTECTIVDTEPTNKRSQNDVLYIGSLIHYRQAQRIDALRKAVKDFIDVIDHNDEYEDDTNEKPREGGRLGNRISIVTFASNQHIDVQNSLQNGTLGNGKAAELKALVDGFRLYQGTRPALGVEQANLQFKNYVNETRMTTASRTVVVFTDGEPYGETRDAAIAQTLVSKRKPTTDVEGYDATVFTVGMFSSTPTENDDTWRFMNYMSSNAPNATTNNTPGTDFNASAGYYKDASDPNMDLSAVFTEIAHQSGGSSTSLSASSSNVDVVSHSFILPQGADAEHIGDYVKIFVAKLEKIDENGEYVFYEEILKGHTPDNPVNDRDGYYFYPLDEDGEIIGELTKVDAGISVTLDDTDDHKIAVTGFDYSSMYCGPVYALDGSVDHYQGYKIIIMIPIKMNPDAVGGPDVETNGAGSGIYVKADDAAAFVPYVSPTVSLPVNIHITKSGLKPGESAKFMIERANLPKEGPVNYNNLTWRYVSTVFVTRPQNAKDTDPDPIVYVRGLPANEDVKTTTGEGDDAVTTTEHLSFVYRISEENWSWSYDRNTLPQYTDTDYIDNPFRFSNTPKDNIDVKVRHAESKATNIFKPGVVTGNVKYDDSKKNTGTGRD